MKLTALLIAAVAVCSSPAVAAPVPGQLAPAFRGIDVNGKPVSLADFRGKTVVLEWNNPNCPFVQKHYTSGNMQSLQKEATAKGVVWLSISSTAKSHVEYLAPATLAQRYKEWGGAYSAMLMDDDGAVGVRASVFVRDRFNVAVQNQRLKQLFRRCLS